MRIDRVKFGTELIRQDMTQTKLANLAGVSRATVNNVRSGKRCSEAVARRISAALNIPLEQLLER